VGRSDNFWDKNTEPGWSALIEQTLYGATSCPGDHPATHPTNAEMELMPSHSSHAD